MKYLIMFVVVAVALCSAQPVDSSATKQPGASRVHPFNRHVIIGSSGCPCPEKHVLLGQHCVSCAKYKYITGEDCPVCKS